MKLAQLEYHTFPHSDNEDDYFFTIRGNSLLSSLQANLITILVPDLNFGKYEDISMTFILLVHVSTGIIRYMELNEMLLPGHKGSFKGSSAATWSSGQFE